MCLSSFKVMVTVGLSNHGSFLFAFLKRFCAHSGELVMHACVPFCNDALLGFFGAP